VGWIGWVREQPWRITIAAVGGLLIAIFVAGFVGLLSNLRVENVTDEARYDLDLEDEGDDLRAAVLDLRHYQRNITFSGPSKAQIDNFEDAYDQLEEEIRELEGTGIRDPQAPQPDRIRTMAQEYYSDFRPAIGLYGEDPDAFERASDRGLERLDELAQVGEDLDELGERLSAESLAEVDRATQTARVVLLAVLFGLLLAGATLAYITVRVVSELRKSYDKQQEAAERAAEASQAKTDFIADVSHELRTPLTVLRGNAQVGLALGGDREQAELFEEIVEESRRMTRLVEDLLFLARSDAASVPLQTETVDAVLLLHELAGRAESLAHERGATFESEISVRGQLRVDSARIGQAVLILVDNAAKYGPADGLVTLSSEITRSGQLRIAVKDRGPGISSQALPHVFERFYRADKTRTRLGDGEGTGQGGTGLGLPIARTIVEAHGGHIEAVSQPETGTEVSLYLPMLSVPWHADRAAGHPSISED
jgi:two-component system, OmpR family, sensor histidine kinase VicK